LPGDAFYIPEFITQEEEQRLLQKVGPFWDSSFYICAAPFCDNIPMVAERSNLLDRGDADASTDGRFPRVFKEK